MYLCIRIYEVHEVRLKRISPAAASSVDHLTQNPFLLSIPLVLAELIYLKPCLPVRSLSRFMDRDWTPTNTPGPTNVPISTYIRICLFSKYMVGMHNAPYGYDLAAPEMQRGWAQPLSTLCIRTFESSLSFGYLARSALVLPEAFDLVRPSLSRNPWVTSRSPKVHMASLGQGSNLGDKGLEVPTSSLAQLGESALLLATYVVPSLPWENLRMVQRSRRQRLLVRGSTAQTPLQGSGLTGVENLRITLAQPYHGSVKTQRTNPRGPVNATRGSSFTM
ncbi:hypothetical protein ACRALDRAFT_210875 [Sodiomyces alcalophilus JCM 7366]|uniref:uncharacterized protein n=1 Tax=Sodiomyces alcalophilus JCM 7366 TaxID=591952 RepID=UPI0039B49F90